MSGVKWIELQKYLNDVTGLCYFNSSNSELITRCYNCETNSNKNHGHLYIKVDEDSLIYNCFRCEESGTIVKLIKQYNGTPEKFLSKEILERKWSDKSKSIFKKVNKKTFNTDNQNVDKFKLKVQYLKGRLGYEVDIYDIPNLILDFDTFIYENNINLNVKQKGMMNFLESNFVGFLTSRGTHVVCRNIDETSDFRYYKLHLIQDDMLFKDFYGIQTGPISSNINTVVMCEGPFDLLVPYYSLEFTDLKRTSCFWSAILGKRYDTSIQSVLDYCSISKANLYIFSDSDMEYNDKILKNVRLHPQIQSVDFLWNTTGKDFGKHPIIPTKNSFNYKFFK